MADKSFGVKELNLLNASGTPTVTSPNNLNLNANTVAISTSCTVGSNLTVSGDIDVDGHTNLDNVSVAGVSTFADDITVQKNMHFGDSPTGTENLLSFGAGDDLNIFHSGNGSFIRDSGTGSLTILTNQFLCRNAANNEELIEAFENSSVSLFFNGTKRLETTNTGAVVTGILTATTFSGDPSNDSPHSLWDVVNNSASSYRFTGPGQDGAEDNPDIYLVRGQRYVFKMNASGHPFQIRVANGGAAYSDGVTNNGAQTGNVVFNVQHDAPAQLYYQCTSHGGMVGNIYIVGGPQVISGVVTATTFSGNLSGGTVSGTTGTFTNNLSVAQNIVHIGDTDTKIEFLTDTIALETAGSERLRITSGGKVNIGGDYTQTTRQLGVVSSAEQVATFEYNGADADGSEVRFYHNSSSPADNDTLAFLQFSGKNSADEVTLYSAISAQSSDVTNGTEDGNIIFSTRSNGSFGERLRISSTGAVTKPAQPCAVVYECTGPAGSLANAASDNQEPLHFNHVHINQGGMTISQDNGRIEVPVTGIYFVSYMVSGTVTNVDTNDGIELILMVNGNEYPATNSGAEPVFNFGHGHNNSVTSLEAHTEYNCSNTLLVSLTAGDYVEVALDNIGSGDGSVSRGNFCIMLMA